MKDKIIKLFLEMVQIDSPSGEEKAMGVYVEDWLKKNGFKYHKDALGSILTTNFENPQLLLCAHMDTVEPGRGVKPIIKDGFIQSEQDTILGADNKATVSAIFCAVEKYKDIHGELPNIELLFTVKEETGGGVEFFPLELVKSKQGVTFDYSKPFGRVTITSPFIYNFEAKFVGKSAHASRPEEGKNSLLPAAKFILQAPQGKLDEGKTTINIGQVNSGTGINIVPEETVIKGEVRSTDKKLFDEYLTLIKDNAGKISKESGVELQYKLDGYCAGYSHSEDDLFIQKIISVYQAMDINTCCDSSTVISDANILNGVGIKVVNLADGCENVHTTRERVSVDNLCKLEKIVLNVVEKFVGK